MNTTDSAGWFGFGIFCTGAVAQDTKIGVLNAPGALQFRFRWLSTELNRLCTKPARPSCEQLQTLQSEYQQNEAVMTEDEIRE